jgi:hypothetical protein
MAWRETVLRHVGPGLMGGVTFGRWVRVLRENRFAVAPSCWPRALSITFQSLQNSVFHWNDRRLTGAALDGVDVLPPVFVLGHWRNGTTHLHNLLTVDRRFAFPSNYECLFPLTFLTAERFQSRVVDFFLPARRPMDNVQWTMQSPQEDEFAQCVTSFKSPCMKWAFPRRWDQYEKYLTFRGVPERDVAEWRAALLEFLRKLTWKHGRPLVLKSPPHTCRIKLLLEIFPGAKFVHIHRDPFVVFPSAKRTHETNIEWHRLQRAPSGVDDRILRTYREMYDVFFEERGLVPAGQFCEVGYEELERDPIVEVRRIYEALGLPDFSEVEGALRGYVESIAGYRKNRHPELSGELRGRISREWRKSIEEWGYSG